MTTNRPGDEMHEDRTDQDRATNAARHRKLFELLNNGDLQARRLAAQPEHAAHAVLDRGAEAFRDMAGASLPSVRRPFWQR